DPEHIRRIQFGVQDWNRWRRSHPSIRPDLSQLKIGSGRCVTEGDHLAQENLTRADLSRADLSGANLAGADLQGARLAGAPACPNSQIQTGVSQRKACTT